MGKKKRAKKLELSKLTVRTLTPVAPKDLDQANGGALKTRYCTPNLEAG